MSSIYLLKLSLEKKIILSIIFLVLFILSIIFFIILPAVKDIKDIRDDIDSQRIDLEKRYINGQNIRSLSEKLNKVESQIAILDQSFINKNCGLEFITTLEEIADKNKIVQKINLSAQINKNDDLYKKIPVQFFTQGNFLNQLNYLIDLEALNYYINIKSIEIISGNFKSLDPNDGDSNQSRVNMIIQADTYWKQ